MEFSCCFSKVYALSAVLAQSFKVNRFKLRLNSLILNTHHTLSSPLTRAGAVHYVDDKGEQREVLSLGAPIKQVLHSKNGKHLIAMSNDLQVTVEPTTTSVCSTV